MPLMTPSRHEFVLPDVEGMVGAGLRMVYWQWGAFESERVAVCVHGLTRQGRDFDHLATALAQEGWRVIAPDIIGRGESDWLTVPGDYHNGAYALHMLTLLDHLALPTVHWIGTSMGGLIGMFLASLQPQRIWAMVMNDVGPYLPRQALARIAAFVHLPVEFASRDEAEAALRARMAPWGAIEDDVWQHLLKHSMRQQPNGTVVLTYDPAIGQGLKPYLDTPEEAEDMDLWAQWQTVTCPVLIVRGTESDVLTQDVAQAMKQGRRYVQEAAIAHTGHAPSLTEATQMHTVVSWLNQHP